MTTEIDDHLDFISQFTKNLDVGKLDYLNFANEIMSDYMAEEPDTFFPLATMHKQWIKKLSENERVAIICARGHLKTSFSLTYLMWNMLYNPNFRALYIGNTFSQVVDKLGQFEELALRSWRIAPQIPKQSKRWNMNLKQFNNGSRVRGAVIGGALEGPHVHLIILDDILEEFPRLTDPKIINYLNRVVLPMRLPQAQMLLIGTQKRPEDVTAYVKNNPKWETIWHPALKKNGRPRWPQYWNLSRLNEEKAAMGSRAFESEYMLNPIDPDSAIIPWTVLEPCLNREEEMYLEPLDGKEWRTYMGVDLAVGQSAQHDKTAYAVVAYNRETEQRKLLYCWSGTVRGEGGQWLKAQVDNIRKIYDMFTPTSIMVESNGFQRLVAHAARDVENLPIKTHNTGSERNHSMIGVPRIAVAMEKNLYTIPFGKEASQNNMAGTEHLVRGLMNLMWDNNGRIMGHIADPVIAMWMCELAIDARESKRLNTATWDWL